MENDHCGQIHEIEYMVAAKKYLCDKTDLKSHPQATDFVEESVILCPDISQAVLALSKTLVNFLYSS